MASFSRKHYEKIAGILKVLPDGSAKDTAVRSFLNVFREDNSRFDQYRFLKAVGYKDKEIDSKFGLGLNESRSFDGFGSAVVPVNSIGMTSESGTLRLRNALPSPKIPKKLDEGSGPTSNASYVDDYESQTTTYQLWKIRIGDLDVYVATLDTGKVANNGKLPWVWSSEREAAKQIAKWR